MEQFEEIRAYNDEEVDETLAKIIADREFIDAICKFKFPRLPVFLRGLIAPFIRFYIKRQVKDIHTVWDFQDQVSYYMDHMIESTMTGFTTSGMEKLDPNESYLFISNHRDITLDPAFLNFARFRAGMDTIRIAVGDNLLSKQFVEDLMRINKSFIVKRSAKAPRKMLANLKLMAEYIWHSLKNDGQSIWIAQREGRAKNGIDRTDPAIIKMFAINNRKDDFSGYIKSLNIVPLSISYEYDPCDYSKAKELHAIDTAGEYKKAEHEDVTSIAQGISSFKGHVHLSFGEILKDDFDTPEEIADWLDKQIISNYVLHPSNYFAYHRLYGEFPDGVYSNKRIPFNAPAMSKEKRIFDARLDDIPEPYKTYVLHAYANPIVSKKEYALK